MLGIVDPYRLVFRSVDEKNRLIQGSNGVRDGQPFFIRLEILVEAEAMWHLLFRPVVDHVSYTRLLPCLKLLALRKPRGKITYRGKGDKLVNTLILRGLYDGRAPSPRMPHQ